MLINSLCPCVWNGLHQHKWLSSISKEYILNLVSLKPQKSFHMVFKLQLYSYSCRVRGGLLSCSTACVCFSLNTTQTCLTRIMHVELREQRVTNLFRLPLMFVCDSNLPAKSAEEAQKHRQQYEEMVAQAKKRGELIRQHNQCCLTIFYQSVQLQKVISSLEPRIHHSYKLESLKLDGNVVWSILP